MNPLVSFQFAKNEFGEKTFKPLVNLHVTPNENIINKVGNLFKAKKYGGYGLHQNQHYHTHTHAHYPAQTIHPAIYHPHHYENVPYFESSPHFNPVHNHYIPSGYEFDAPSGYYRESSTNYLDSDVVIGSLYEFDPNTNTYYSRSANASIVAQTYANNYANYKQNQEFSYTKSNIDNKKQDTQSVSFPNNRRKRSVDTANAIGIDNKSIASRLKKIEKVIKMV